MKINIEIDGPAETSTDDMLVAARGLLAMAGGQYGVKRNNDEIDRALDFARTLAEARPEDLMREKPKDIGVAEPAEQKPARTRRTKAEMDAAAAPAPEQQTALPAEEPAPAPAEPAPAPAAAPAAAVPDFAAVKAAAVDLVNKHGGEIQSALTKFISVQFKDADGNPARLFTLTDDGRAKTMATVQACAALADKDAILKHLAV